MSSAVQSPPSAQPLGETPQTVEFYVGMTNRAVKRCAPGEFEARALENSLFESIPDGVPVKVYFDADHKFTTDFELYNERAAGEVMRLHKLYVGNHLRQITGVEPKFAHAEASYKSRLIKGVEHWAYSFHLVVPNITMSKSDIKRMARDLNEFIVQDQKAAFTTITGADKYTDYIPEMTEAFDLAVYNSGVQKVRCVHASKEGETRPFKLAEGSFDDMVITAFVPADATHCALPAPAAAPTTTMTSPALPGDKAMNRVFAELCFERGMFFEAAKKTTDWTATGLFIKGYFGDNEESYTLFDKFSKLAGAPEYKPLENREKWDGFAANPDKYDNFGTFVNWAKKDNAAKYKEIAGEIATLKKNAKAAAKTRKGPKPKLEDADTETLTHYEQYIEFDIATDIGQMMFLTKAEPNKFMWIRDKGAKVGDLHSWTGTRWEVGTLEFERFIATAGVQMAEDIKARAQKELSDENPIKQMVLGACWDALKAFKSRTSQLKIIASSEAFFTRDIQFDANVDIIGFNNGIYDLVKHEFRPTKYDDYITMSCGYDYNPNVNPAKMAEVHALLDTIIPNPENRQLLLEVMSAGLTGRAIEKFVLFNGGGRNGKGLLDEFLKTIFGDYQLIYANVSLLTEKDKTGGNPEKASLHNKRIVIMKEPDGNEPLRNDRVKDITGGGNVSGRMLYSNKTIVNLNLILIMECNDRPKFKTEPTHAEDERVIDILFPNRFSTLDDEIDNVSVFKANGDYKTDEWKNAHRDEFLQIIIAAFKAFQSRDYAFAIPQNVKDRTRAYLNASFPILEIFGELYTKTGARTDVVKLKDIYDEVKGSATFLEFDKKDKRMYNYKYFCEFVEKNREFKRDYHIRHQVGAEQYKNVLVGYVLTTDLEEAEEG